jgi:hypothetical protein
VGSLERCNCDERPKRSECPEALHCRSSFAKIESIRAGDGVTTRLSAIAPFDVLGGAHPAMNPTLTSRNVDIGSANKRRLRFMMTLLEVRIEE